jgi:hypothetical protein
MTALTQDLLAQLQGAPLQQIASQLGVDPQQASGAISTALPLLMGKLGSNAASEDGAQALLGALQNNHSGLDISSVLGAVMGGGGSAAANGAGILGHIFGGQQDSAQAGVAQATGLPHAQSGQLLQMLAPMVMAYLGNHVSANGASASALSGLLGQEHQAIAQQGGAGGSLLGSLLDQDGDGQLGLGDALKIGSSLFGGGGR